MDMFVMSRHYSKYINSMFPAMLHQYIEGESHDDYATDEQLKPMNCPNHIQIFKSQPRSYRELPIRMGELGTVYRYERAGTLHGMTRVRGFTQDDSHIFCKPDQVVEEVRGVIRLTKQTYEMFGFKDYQAYISTRPEKYLGSLEMWDFAEKSLKEACEAEGVNYKIDEGEGVFYGPKIDSKVKDSMGREWQLGTIQFDFNMPDKAETTEQDIEEFWNMKTFKDKFKTKERLEKYLKKLGRGFDVRYVDDKGQEEKAVMIHRTVLGSMERFFGVLIEHYAGAFPVWLSPVQVKVLPITDKQLDYAQKIKSQLIESGIRVEVDERNEKLGAKIRDAQMEKVPYMVVVGGKEEEAEKVAVRLRNGEDLGQIDLTEFRYRVREKIEKKALDL
jgi:threonyl-tRNA synthetase